MDWAERETLDTSVAGTRLAFATKFKGLLWILTTILPFVVSSWHRKEAVFYLPHGWFGPTAWPMGLPSAPAGNSLFSRSHCDDGSLLSATGAIACGVWTMVCKRFLGVLKGIVVDLTTSTEVKVPILEVPVAATTTTRAEGKKEL